MANNFELRYGTLQNSYSRFLESVKKGDKLDDLPLKDTVGAHIDEIYEVIKDLLDQIWYLERENEELRKELRDSCAMIYHELSKEGP